MLTDRVQPLYPVTPTTWVLWAVILNEGKPRLTLHLFNLKLLFCAVTCIETSKLTRQPAHKLTVEAMWRVWLLLQQLFRTQRHKKRQVLQKFMHSSQPWKRVINDEINGSEATMTSFMAHSYDLIIDFDK